VRDQSQMLDLFSGTVLSETAASKSGKTAERLRRLDLSSDMRKAVLPYCRLKSGEIWQDSVRGHRVGVLDATKLEDVARLCGPERAVLAVNDPPYNIAVGNANTANLFFIDVGEYLKFSERWVRNALVSMAPDAHFYVWIGADYRNDFQPFPDFLILMRSFEELKSKNFITVRNQRGYGTQKNWMWVRQELLYYQKGNPEFNVGAEYTDIPKHLRGYYKIVGGKKTENFERSKSKFIRAGNVWIDVQQVFYRLEENVPGCYAQKPLRAIERIISSGTTQEGQLVLDLFSHSGTSLIAGERLKRKIFTCDLDPIFAEITIRRLEHFRETGKTGWQWRNPFPELETDSKPARWI